MTKGSLRCVIDASVAIKLFVVDPLSDKVDALFAHLGADPECRFYVPDLFYIECTNILWKYVRLSPYSAADAERNLARLYALSLQRHVILAFITSVIPTDLMATDIVLDTSDPDFAATGLRVSSAIRLHRLMTVSTALVKRELGVLSSDKQDKIAEKLCKLLSE